MNNLDFNTNLNWRKVLELLNKLAEYKIASVSSSGRTEYIIIELNEKTKNYLCNLGCNLSKDPFVDLEKERFSILRDLWNDIAFHYDKKLYFDGTKFIEKDKEKQELISALKELKNVLKGIPTHDDKPSLCVKMAEEILAKYEGDNNG